MVFAMSKDNEQLQKDVNAALKELKDNGTYDKIHAKWFGASSK
jgi:glutamine transport system substrate-binding protein